MNEDRDPDIVQLVLAACKAEGFDTEAARIIELKICSEYGGRRVYISKKKVYDDKKKRVFNEGLSDKSTAQVVKDAGISRATLYRLMKRGA
jgi:hypothetical protein